jgi:outer membrane lipoprotein-sorting protein
MRPTNIFFAALLSVLYVIPAAAQYDKTAQEVVGAAYNRPTGQDMTADLEMILINRQGDRRVREIKQYGKDFGDVEKTIMFFLSPADVRNTSFMNWSYDEAKDDDQWIYLPALKRVRRISGDGKSDYFMGSDFTYDDLGDRHPNEDEHTIIRMEEIDGVESYVIESIPKEKDYMYSRTITWIAKDKWIALKREFYDDRGEYLKTLWVKEYDNIQGYWTVLHSEMENEQRRHKTVMQFKNVDYDTGVSDNMFTERIMTRGL